MRRAILLLTILAATLVSASGVAWAIIKGTPDEAGTYNKVAVLRDGTGYSCTGTLISRQYVLTAAHCYPLNSNWKPASTPAIDVLFGSPADKPHPGQFIKSPYYSGSKNDVGLVKLDLALTDQDLTGISPAGGTPETVPLPKVGQFTRARTCSPASSSPSATAPPPNLGG